ncbi:MAG: hypothetical protein R3F62_19145 [Planctomycetota bacterium]
MSKRPQTSVLLIGADELVRADVVGTEVVPYRGARPAEVDDLPLLVEATLALGPTPGRKVLVLATDLWTQVLELPAASTRGASAQELEQALKFEAEGLSGLPALEAALGFASLGERGAARSFWVTQLPLGELEAVDGLLRDRGLSLAGVAHPGGVPAPLNGSAPGEPWRRTELWPGLRLELSHDPRVGLAVEVEPSDAGDQALALDEGEHHLLLAPDLRLDAPPERHPAALSDPATFARWVGAWSAEAAGGHAPAVRPAARPLPTSVWVILSVVLAVATLAACWAHTRWVEGGVEALERELESLGQSSASSDQAIKRHQALTQAVGALEATLGEVEHSLEAERCRVADLLGALAEAPEGIVLEGIDDRGRAVTIRGSTPDPQLPSQLATRLAEALSAHGWRMAPPQAELLGTLDGAPRWRFTLVLGDPLAPGATPGAPGSLPHAPRTRRGRR